MVLFFKAYALFILIDAGFHFYGFGKVYKFIIDRSKNRPERELSGKEDEIIALTSQAVTKANRFYYRKRKDCLPKALTMYYLLRGKGIPVNFCMGVTKFPFAGHSWVEYQGEVIDDPEAKGYALLSRT